MSTETIQDTQKQDEYKTLLQQAYEGLMEIGANIAAKKIIVHDLSRDNQFNLGDCARCVVGWAWGGPEGAKDDNWYAHGFYSRISNCFECVHYSTDLLRLQYAGGNSYIAFPTNLFLKQVIEFTRHFKVTHNGCRI